ncbi:GH25 family lysozyme [Bilifractor sp. LCP21S3_E12]|uniref:GH25 family lysozyme n=1 Tax=unclassified Bilifractor TaxID=2815795 RepID=UPI003F90E2F6
MDRCLSQNVTERSVSRLCGKKRRKIIHNFVTAVLFIGMIAGGPLPVSAVGNTSVNASGTSSQLASGTTSGTESQSTSGAATQASSGNNSGTTLGTTLVGQCTASRTSPAAADASHANAAGSENEAGTAHGGSVNGEKETDTNASRLPLDLSGVTRSVSSDSSSSSVSSDSSNSSGSAHSRDSSDSVSSTSSASADPDTTGEELYYFQDVYGHTYSMYRNLTCVQSPYQLSGFSCQDQRMMYSDDTYTSRLGIDISQYQGDIDWAQVKAAGFDFVFIRVGTRGYESGSIYEDERWAENLKEARTAGLDAGVYFFSGAVSEQEAEEEADYIIEKLNGEPLELGIVLDVETIGSGTSRHDDLSAEQYTADTSAFCERVKAAGYNPIVYSNIFWEATHYDMTKIGNYDVWYADYMTTPQTPYMYRFWQYTDSGTVPGINGSVDLDVELIPKSDLVERHGVFLLDALQQAVLENSSGGTEMGNSNDSSAGNRGVDLIQKQSQ